MKYINLCLLLLKKKKPIVAKRFEKSTENSEILHSGGLELPKAFPNIGQ